MTRSVRRRRSGAVSARAPVSGAPRRGTDVGYGGEGDLARTVGTGRPALGAPATALG
ncbi:hypothetical protein [Nonomuraea sp. B19D2]|uniref:hypothetical protein n=1 Tax=Nonomuraea sp. B19D2 TaxID=3159561 RepID=UPI0032DA77AF